MSEYNDLKQQAMAIPKDERGKKLMSFKETELHTNLKELFRTLEPNYTVEITHQPGELGKDLVIVRKDKIGTDVLGVVVKMGNIRGKTVGEVDEIKTLVKNTFTRCEEMKIEQIISQVEQALLHPAQMRTIFEKLPISKVLIILAGELSNQARARLNKELVDHNREIWDIDELTDKFTEHYPQVFFEGKVIDFLQEKIQILEKKHWLSQKGKRLSEYFIDPLVATIDIPVKFDEANLALIIEKRKFPFSQLKSVFKQSTRLILVGDPGVGKSVALDKLAIDMMREASFLLIRGVSKEHKIEIPLMVTAKEILEADSPETLIKNNFLSPDIINRFKISVLMIDALDEAPQEERIKIIEKGSNFSKELSCSIVITSRKIDVIKTPPTGFEKYELLPFEYGQALKLFKKLVSNQKLLEVLQDGLKKIEFQIPMVPLSLMLLVELVEKHKEVPASVTELYDRFYDLMLGRWDEAKGLEVLFEYYAKKRFLAELAFLEFLSKGRLKLPLGDFERFTDIYAENYDLDKEKMKQFIKEIERAGIIDIKKSVVFRHRSFLDYSAAFYIFNKQTDFKDLNDFITKIYFEDIWGDVVFFYIGLKREISDEILVEILKYKEEDLSGCINKLLTGRLLQAGWSSIAKTKYNGIEKAISFTQPIRDKMFKIIEKSSVKIPMIFTDFLIMSLSSIAFGSIFLAKEIQSIYSELSTKPSRENAYKMLSLLWAIQQFLTKEELRGNVNNFLGTISKIPDYNTKEQVGSLVLLRIISQQDRSLVKTITRHVEKLKKKSPATFKQILPHKRKGFRE